ncbi:ubiquinone/menaquinone biosynthesis C-methylase UbiE [Paenibacillus cellulosilyticus]|uniref:Ubiquinone/menaquinone biosynthesis C-methylase UbiE n=1 Tax=Paenibacillus cellulosilyticus TaxID=375489 RepID=A0A2V2YXC2_9BACL|nr:class I SAM-dependent methyltransferase [Paenibacillus cellulosilyticus]PWW06264.1 ubiquinone/menaquinone biosynthesis C-methylase UbiE [Paenibacillus cellulosilyticus]
MDNNAADEAQPVVQKNGDSDHHASTVSAANGGTHPQGAAHACRVCGGGPLTRWVHLPAMPLTEELRPPSYSDSPYLADIDVYRCAVCGVSQTVGERDLSPYYVDYGYTVGQSPFAARFMQRLADTVRDRFGLQEGFKVVEIGSGDGAQLACFQRAGAEVFGVEPSAELCRESRARGVPVMEALFMPQTAALLPEEFQPADVLLMTYTFDHLPDPSGTLEAARRTLHPGRGLLVLEVHDLTRIVERREYCLFEHEHYTYWTAETLGCALARSGFRLLTTELLPEHERRGNSLLIAAAAMDAAHSPESEVQLAEWSALDYDKFQQEMDQGIAALDAFVEAEASQGRTVAGYGGGGRGVMTMAAMSSAWRISYVCDANTGLHGLLAPKSRVPVVAIDRLSEEPVDTLIVFSYGYMAEIREAVEKLPGAPKQIVSMLDILK